MKAILRSGVLALAIMALAVPVNAGPFEDGLAAYQRRDHAIALEIWIPLAEQGGLRISRNKGRRCKSGWDCGLVGHCRGEAVA